MIPNTAEVNLGNRFAAAYASQDWPALRSLLVDDVEWTLPGNARISGTARGPQAVLDRVEDIITSGVRTELLHVTVGQDGVALLLRNTAEHPDGRRLDEHLAIILHPRDGRVARIDSYLSDVAGMVAFFGVDA